MISLKYQFLRRLGHMTYLPFGVRDRAIRLFAHPDRIESRPFVTPFFGSKYPGDLARFLDWEVYFYGSYETGILSLLEDITGALEPSPVTFIDVGANVGHHSLFMAGKADQVIAFEPFETVRAEILTKIEINSLDNIRVEAFALGNSDETLPYFAPSGHNIGTGSLLKTYNSSNIEANSPVSVRNGDTYFAAHPVAAAPILKIDVEGFEPDVLAGLQTFIADHRPAIVMELSEMSRRRFGTWANLQSMVGADYGFREIVQRPPGYRLTKFDFDEFDGNLLIAPTDLLDKISG